MIRKVKLILLKQHFFNRSEKKRKKYYNRTYCMFQYVCILTFYDRSDLPLTQDRILAKDPILPTYIKTPAGCVWCVARLSLEWNCIAADMDYFAAFASGRDTFIEIGVNQIYCRTNLAGAKKTVLVPHLFRFSNKVHILIILPQVIITIYSISFILLFSYRKT